MPRRRMIDPKFWKDPEVARLTIQERLLFIGIISNADDEGRIIATPEALKADIFPYDRNMTAGKVKKMRDSLVSKMKNVLLYDDDQAEYIVLLRWKDHQKPKHSKPSTLPAPPTPLYAERGTPSPPQGETLRETLGVELEETSGSSRSVKSSIGKSSIGKSSIGKDKGFDFKNKDDTELTKYLTSLLDSKIARGATWCREVIVEFWEQTIGVPDATVFRGALAASRDYPPHLIAEALVKAKNYGAGKHHSWNYVTKILDEIQSNTSKGDG